LRIFHSTYQEFRLFICHPQGNRKKNCCHAIFGKETIFKNQSLTCNIGVIIFGKEISFDQNVPFPSNILVLKAQYLYCILVLLTVTLEEGN